MYLNKNKKKFFYNLPYKSKNRNFIKKIINEAEKLNFTKLKSYLIFFLKNLNSIKKKNIFKKKKISRIRGRLNKNIKKTIFFLI